MGYSVTENTSPTYVTSKISSPSHKFYRNTTTEKKNVVYLVTKDMCKMNVLEFDGF